MVTISGAVEEVIEFLKDRAGEHVRVAIEFEKPVSREPRCGIPPEISKGTDQLFLDADEVAVRLGFMDRESPRDAVKYLHRTKQLVAVKISGRLRWRPEDVEAFARKMR